MAKANVLKKHWLAYHKKICQRDGAPILEADTGRSRRPSFYCDVCQVLYWDNQ